MENFKFIFSVVDKILETVNIKSKVLQFPKQLIELNSSFSWFCVDKFSRIAVKMQ